MSNALVTIAPSTLASVTGGFSQADRISDNLFRPEFGAVAATTATPPVAHPAIGFNPNPKVGGGRIME